MPLIQVVIVILVVGVLVWLVQRAPFIADQFKQIATWVAVVAVVLWLLSLFFPGALDSVRVGRVP